MPHFRGAQEVTVVCAHVVDALGAVVRQTHTQKLASGVVALGFIGEDAKTARKVSWETVCAAFAARRAPTRGAIGTAPDADVVEDRRDLVDPQVLDGAALDALLHAPRETREATIQSVCKRR